MQYIMSLDGGGTKLNCIIADENGRYAGMGRGGPTNIVYSSRSLVEESIRSAISGALESGKVNKNDVCIVNSAMIISEPWTVEIIRDVLNNEVKINFFSEFELSLYAAIQEDYGGLVLSGTGSFASIRTPNSWVTVGGWGDALGDEGSGYYIGHKALKACAQMEDGILPYTMIKERIQEKYKIDTMRMMISELSNAPLGHQRTMIASICPIVGWCANQGDAVAIGIIKRAAFYLAKQMLTVMKRSGTYDIPVTVSGGAWKATPMLFSSLYDAFKEEYQGIELRPPLFEPVVGGILMGLRAVGYPVKENIDMLKKEFENFAYSEEFFKQQ